MNTMKVQLSRQASILLFVSALFGAATLGANAATLQPSQGVPSGPLSISFTNRGVPVYDLTGGYVVGEEAAASGSTNQQLSLGFALQQDATGRLRGSGVTNILVGADRVAAQYSVNGKVAGGGGKATRAVFSVRWVSQGGTGSSSPFTITVQYNLEVSPWVLNGTARGKAKFGTQRGSSIKGIVTSLPLPPGADGNWTLQMNLQPPGGSAVIAFSNGRNLQASLTAKYSAGTGIDKIKVAGVGSDKGNTLSFAYAPATAGLQNLSGKLLGQAVSLKNAGALTVNKIIASTAAASAFAGSQACQECHSPIQQTLNFTRHAQVGVGCENCHGPAANHAANDYNPAARPPIPYDGATCGTCHSGPQHPIYEDWKQSAHAEVVEDLNPPALTTACGRCHSGSVRVSLVDNQPVPIGNANQPLGCPTCHEAHELTGNPFQVRNPLYSTNDYVLTTTSVFTNNYNPAINLCGQCHNSRGARYTDTGRSPHPSPQYNMLLGTVGEVASGLPHYDPGSHALLITNQCVGCHMQTAPFVSAAQPAVTGHQFNVNSFQFCAGCHGSAANASNLVVFVSGLITNQLATLQGSLNEWATNKAPAILGTAQYGTLAWEYTIPGPLSPAGSGPTTAQQALIPANIKKARFNLYLVSNDGSLGVHNPNYTAELLAVAQSLVNQELAP
jgi:hypothetical protein